MARWKFDDCGECRFRRKPVICRECDYGEQFESADVQELRFDDSGTGFSRANKSLVTEDDEPHFNPDDLIERLDAAEENRDDDENE